MAWKETISKSCANRSVALTEIDTQLVAMGWTKEDDQTASAYIVYSSIGEASAYLKKFLMVDWNTGNRIILRAYGGWDTVAHTGTSMCSASHYGLLTTSESGFTFWMYGNMDMLMCYAKVSTTYTSAGAGFPKRLVSTVATVTSDTGTGAGITINVSSTTGFTVNDYYAIVGTDASTNKLWYRYRVQVTAIGSGTLTINTLATSLKANNTMIGIVPDTFTCISANAFALVSGINATGSGTNTALGAGSNFFVVTSGDPDY